MVATKIVVSVFARIPVTYFVITEKLGFRRHLLESERAPLIATLRRVSHCAAFFKMLPQQQGFVDAGVTTRIVASACGYAALTKAPPGFEVVRTELKVNLMRPAVDQRFLAIGRVASAGKLLTVCTG